MAEPKTKKTKANVTAFLEGVTPEEKRKDCQKLMEIFEEVTHEKAAMWGTSIVGFGQYHYKSERSTQEGDWPLTGFSPRSQNITIYLMSGFSSYGKLLAELGKHKTSRGSCLYIKRLADINLKILKEIIKESVKMLEKKYSVK